MNVLEFCKEVIDWGKIKENVCNVILVDDESMPDESQIKRYKKYSNLEVASQKIDD
jgi:hypothetical protein